MNNTTLSSFETLLIASGLLFGFATFAVGAVARKKTASLHKGSVYVFWGFLFNFISCISLEMLLSLESAQDTSSIRIFLPILLTIALVWGAFGAVQIAQSIRSRGMFQKLLEKVWSQAVTTAQREELLLL